MTIFSQLLSGAASFRIFNRNKKFPAIPVPCGIVAAIGTLVFPSSCFHEPNGNSLNNLANFKV
jgi:hypothetical protein